MPDYRRSWVPGGTYFFTVVTYHRQPILTSDLSRQLLRQAWIDVKHRFPFTVDAFCLLPDHIRCIWILPEDDANYTMRWKEIKRLFTKGYLEQIGPGEARNPSRLSRGEAATPIVPGPVWQRRFWEHTI
jgi:putative transposase